MKTIPVWVGSLMLAVIGTLLVSHDARAASKGSKNGGGHSSAARAGTSHSSAQAWHQSAAARQAQAQAQAQTQTQSKAKNSAQSSTSSTGTGQTTSSSRNGTGRARSYANRSLNRGYRGSSYGNRYATANQNIRAIVSRLRQTHSSLARVNHDYQGHRSRAMHDIRQAIQQLTSRQGTSYGTGTTGTSALGANVAGANARGGNALMGNTQTQGGNAQGLRNRAVAGAGAGAGAGRGQLMNQGQSDAYMQRALQNLQGVHTQLTSQGSTANHGRARGSVQRAIRELHTALAVR